MRTLLHGENKQIPGTEGFVLLRDLLVMFIVVICFSAAVAAMAVLSSQSSRLLENVQSEINRQNEITIKRFANETN
jgi:hypothetical protein